MKKHTLAQLARKVAEAASQYVDERWMAGQPEEVRGEWRARIYDVLFAAIIRSIELYDRELHDRHQEAGALRSRAMRCPTCGHVAAPPGLGRN